LSSAIAAVGGALYAYYLSNVTSEFFGIQFAIQFIAMIIIGGMGSLPGAVVGAAVWLLLLVTMGYGAVGFYDDYKKIKFRDPAGLAGRWKLFWQFGIGAIALGTQPVQGGNPQGRSEVTVAPPACQRNFPQIEAGRGRNACRCQREACP
jgi:UDP-N-acetylmuramyl pentapeptide phosphotransferase/UDP-N-acetylglucosamine-1-phosphate transferase